MRSLATAFVLSLWIFSFQSHAEETLKEENAVLTDAPNVPPPITRKEPRKVVVHLETREVKKRLADGVEYVFWTFGGSVPGKFIRVREGDLVEFHLENHPSSKMPHNIDLHAVTGPGGGASSSFAAPGHASVFSFRALNPGLYAYHCAAAPVYIHIANGMYGLILVEPKDGLPKADREYYVMQGEFYTKGKNGAHGLQPFSVEKGIDERPEYVVFNGSVGALTGDQSLKANVGEKVRLFVGNGGPNLSSAFHVIGEIFDKVYSEAGTKTVNENVQTTLIPPGGAAIVEFKVEVPGNYVLVDHSIFRAFTKGTLGILKVEGPENKDIFSGKIRDEIYAPADAQVAAGASEQPTAKSKTDRVARGKKVFESTCVACHQAGGAGLAGAFPPLAKSDYLNADLKRAIRTVIAGKTGEITVNGAKYNNVMPPQSLSDEDVANVLTYVLNSWGNSGKTVTPQEVAAERKPTH